jgi:hypothetical protein
LRRRRLRTFWISARLLLIVEDSGNDLQVAKDLHGAGDVAELLDLSLLDELLELGDAGAEGPQPDLAPALLQLGPFLCASFRKLGVMSEAFSIGLQRPEGDFVACASLRVPQVEGIDQDPEGSVTVEGGGSHGKGLS